MMNNVAENKTVYDRLMALNELPHAYEDWFEYRSVVTEYIVNHTVAGSPAVIIGAGGCNDFDLQTLVRHFSNLTLVDIDTAAVYAGMKRQRIACGNIGVVSADIVGIGDKAFRSFSETMEVRAKAGEHNLTQFFLNEMQNMMRTRKPDRFYEEAQFDYVIAIGLHSQLLSVFPRMAGVFSRAGLVDITAIEQAVSAMNRNIMPEINRKLIQMAKVNALFGLEIERIGVPGGIEGAGQALEDLANKGVLDMQAVMQTIWPFCTEEKHELRMLFAHTR